MGLLPAQDVPNPTLVPVNLKLKEHTCCHFTYSVTHGMSTYSTNSLVSIPSTTLWGTQFASHLQFYLQHHNHPHRLQDPYDKARIQALNEVKSEGKTWIAAHAKGGSAPGQAAKRMYVAVDAVQGHANANGAAPLPKQKAKFVASVLDEVDGLMSQGK